MMTMKQSLGNIVCGVFIPLLTLALQSGPSFAATATLTSKIKVISASRSTTTGVPSGRGSKGQAIMLLQDPHQSPGGCYAGNNWLEFDTSDPSYKDQLALATLAYAANKTVFLTYDDGYGAGQHCRIIEVQVQ